MSHVNLPPPTGPTHPSTNPRPATAVMVHKVDISGSSDQQLTDCMRTKNIKAVCEALQGEAEHASVKQFPTLFADTGDLRDSKVPADKDRPGFTPFHSSVYPSMSLFEMVFSVARRGSMRAEIVLPALVLARRAAAALEGGLTAHVLHRLVMGCLLLAHKLQWDMCYNGAAVRKITGLSRTDIKFLEPGVCKLCGWRLHVTAEDVLEVVQWGSAWVPPPPPSPLVTFTVPALQLEESSLRDAAATLPQFSTISAASPLGIDAGDSRPVHDAEHSSSVASSGLEDTTTISTVPSLSTQGCRFNTRNLTSPHSSPAESTPSSPELSGCARGSAAAYARRRKHDSCNSEAREDSTLDS